MGKPMLTLCFNLIAGFTYSDCCTLFIEYIVRSSCVGCGVCSAVCPRGVLKLENGPTENRVEDLPIILGNDGIAKLNENMR